MKCSLSLYPLEAWSSLDEIVGTVAEAEKLGFYGVGLPEHLIVPTGPGAPSRPSAFWVDNFAFGAVLARATRGMRIMLSALVIPYRHPLHHAQGVATLDWISNGRVDVTVGVGWMREEFEALRVPYRERGRRTDDYLRAMRVLWTEPEPAYDGEFVSFGDLLFAPTCVQKPHAPLLIGGHNENAFRRVVEFGAGWAPMMASAESVRAGLVRIREGLAAVGRSDDLRVFTRVSILGGNATITKAAASHKADLVRAQKHSVSRSDAERTIEVMATYREAGVTEFGLSFPWENAARYVETIQWFAAEVMPAL